MQNEGDKERFKRLSEALFSLRLEWGDQEEKLRLEAENCAKYRCYDTALEYQHRASQLSASNERMSAIIAKALNLKEIA